MENKFNYDVIVIGGGPAGLSAALYAGRGCRSVAVLDSALTGGQPSYYTQIANYPGYVSIDSPGLVRNFAFQAESFGAKFYQNIEIERIHLLAKQKEIYTDEGIFIAPAVIIATGAHPRYLNVPEEEKFRFKGISYCAVCDGGFYKNKTVAVLGGGNSACEAALYLSKIAKKVYLIHRRDSFRADEILQRHVRETMNIEIIVNRCVANILGEEKVSGVRLSDHTEINVDGVFPYIGTEPNTELFKDFPFMDENNFIKVNKKQETSVIGVFAAGDVTDSPLKQVVTAAADGAKAGTFALRYLYSVGE